MTLPDVRDRIVRGQAALLDQLEDVIAGNGTETRNG
jgi:hypothetical protein